MSIQSFSDKATEAFFILGDVKKNLGWAEIAKIVRRKLDMLHYATNINDLRSPPGNRLKELEGELSGYYSIRINDQWRIVFKWSDAGPSDVRVVDYH